MTKHRIVLLAAWALWLSCSSSRQNTLFETEKTHRRRIALVPKANTHAYWRSVHAGAAKAAYELDVELVWQGPATEAGQQEQMDIVRRLTAQAVDALVLAPLHRYALVPPVRAAVAKNIPVVVIDSDLEYNGIRSFIATDNRLGGRLAAKRLAALLGGRGRVALLRFNPGSASTTARETGFIEEMHYYAPALELVSTDQYAGVTVEEARRTSEKLLGLHPGLNGVFAPTETSTEGMLQALRAVGRAGQVKLVGFDANPILLEALAGGHVHGLGIQDPFGMGYESIRTAIALLNKQPYEKRLDTGVMMVTKENLADPAVKELLNPDLQKWLRE